MKQYQPKNAGRDNSNCSTVIIGKSISKTGKVIVGHNEDDDYSIVQVHKVPRIKHQTGAVISFDDAKAVIPQVEETYAYYWSEIRCLGGISFADGFVNEWGVAVVSDACRPCKVSETEPEDPGLGYGLRRLIAERAKTAREGMEIAAALVEKYGYISSRSYQICDKEEAWVLQVPTGKRCVARRVGDDEVFYIPNWFTIHEVDFKDTQHKNFYFSKDLVEFAIRNGWYTPKTPGDYSDFDFAAVYQDGQPREHSILRSRNAWRILLGEKPAQMKPFSMKTDKKFGVEDIKAVLRSHYEGTEDDLSENYAINPHRMINNPLTLCNTMTIESSIIEFHDIPQLTCIWRASPKPCLCPFTPWYLGSTTVPKGYEWIDTLAAQKGHFAVDPKELQYDASKAYWAFRTLQYFTEFNYKDTHGIIQDSIKELETQWAKQQSAIENTYVKLTEISQNSADEFLTQYTAQQAQIAWDWANNMIQTLGENKIEENNTIWKEKGATGFFK